MLACLRICKYMQHLQDLFDHISDEVLVLSVINTPATWDLFSNQAMEGLGSEEGENSSFLDTYRGMAKERLILGGLSMFQAVFSGKGGSVQGRLVVESHPQTQKW